MKSWGKKIAVAIHKSFYATLPSLPQVSSQEADIAWMLYDLKNIKESERFYLIRDAVIYTKLEPALEKITTSNAGPIDDFIDYLQNKLDKRLNGHTEAK